MLDELRKQLEKAGNSVAKLQDVLAKYRDFRSQIVKTLRGYDARLQQELEKVPESILENVKQQGTEVLINNAMLAIENTEEFNLPAFRERLVNAIRDSRTISITNGENPIIYINLEITAGTLDDYMAGVQAARETLGLGATRGKFHKETGMELASKIWAEKIYGSAREGKTVSKRTKKGEKSLTSKYAAQYERTIAERLSQMKSMAPWWYILEYGTPNLGGEGVAYPQFAGQRFAENSIPDIKNLYLEAKNNLSQEITKQYDKLIGGLVDIINEIDENINSILRLLQELTNFSIDTDIKIAVSEIEKKLQSLGLRLSDADPEKVLEAAYKFVEGIPIGTAGEKVTLGVGIRFRTIELRRSYEEELAKRINQ